jgi:hypothetical protein
MNAIGWMIAALISGGLVGFGSMSLAGAWRARSAGFAIGFLLIGFLQVAAGIAGLVMATRR